MVGKRGGGGGGDGGKVDLKKTKIDCSQLTFSGDISLVVKYGFYGRVVAGVQL